MFLHILGSGSMFAKEFYKMLSGKFNKCEHLFLGQFPDEDEYKKLNGCKIIQSRSLKMPFYFYKADHILVHGLFNKTVIMFLYFQPWLVKKCNWIVFGADIYSHNKENKSFADKIFEYMKRVIAPKFSYISTFSDGDWKLAQDWYGVKGKNLKVSYPLAGCNAELVQELHKTEKKDSVVRIVIGNSATATNQHMQALDWLARFKDENIQIHLPLNYGLGDYQSYAKEVIAYAESIFGKDKIFPLTEKLNGEDYLRYLNQFDIGLFNNNRQQAMGNITQSVLCGAKVYIRTDTNMWQHYRSLGCQLYDIETIREMTSIDQLLYEDTLLKQRNQQSIASRQDMGLKIQIWNTIFDAMNSTENNRS